MALVGALWLPVIAYALSATFSGVSFGNALWGSSLESDTLGFMLVVAVLGTLTALILRRTEHYRAYLRASGYVFCIVVALEALILIVGQFAPDTISPSFSIVGSYDDLAFLLGLGVIGTLITLRFFELSQRSRRALALVAVGALILLAVANSFLVWVLIALVSLGLFIETVMRHSRVASGADIDDMGVADEAPLETNEGHRSLILPLAALAVSLFFLIGGTLGNSLANTLNVNVLSVPTFVAINHLDCTKDLCHRAGLRFRSREHSVPSGLPIATHRSTQPFSGILTFHLASASSQRLQ